MSEDLYTPTETPRLYPLERRSYSDWIHRLLDSGVNLCRARDVMVDGTGIEGVYNLVMRFDIDGIKPKLILKMAELHEKLGIRGSYYILPDVANYKYYKKHRSLFLDLQSHGHEVGLHVSSVETKHVYNSKLGTTEFFGRPKYEAMERLRQDIAKMVDDGFDVKTMCAHGILWPYTNKDLLGDNPYVAPVAFNRFFSDSDCLFADSQRAISTSRQHNLFDGKWSPPPPGVGFFICHPESYEEDGLITVAESYRFIEDLIKLKLCQWI